MTVSSHGLDHGLRLHHGQTEARLFRLPVEPNDRDGLIATSRLMVDR
jgi:hypothetical protein